MKVNCGLGSKFSAASSGAFSCAGRIAVMETLLEIYSPDRRKRVVFYKRLDNAFGFVEETWG